MRHVPGLALVVSLVVACTGTGPSTTSPAVTVPSITGANPSVTMEVVVLGAAWTGFARRLAEAGWASLAIDLRGHGATGGEEGYTLARRDVRAAWEWLRTAPGVDPARVAPAGASVGANLALVVGAEAGAPAVVALSPGLDYRGVVVEEAVRLLLATPLLLVAQEADSYAADSVAALAEIDPEARVVVRAGRTHGTDMLDDELETEIIDFLAGDGA
jgi:dienelactone hydrolase